MGRSIIGQDHIFERLILGLLCNGNLLVEGLPGLAKTRAVKGLAKNMESEFSRIQFTPDLLPSDVTGTEIYHQAGGHRSVCRPLALTSERFAASRAPPDAGIPAFNTP